MTGESPKTRWVRKASGELPQVEVLPNEDVLQRLAEDQERVIRRIEAGDSPRVQGYTATSDGPQHWTQSADPGNRGFVDPRVTRIVVPKREPTPILKRTPQQRLQALSDELIAAARESKRMYGRVIFPSSIVKRMKDITRGMGDEVTEESIQSYARALLEEDERRRGIAVTIQGA